MLPLIMPKVGNPVFILNEERSCPYGKIAIAVLTALLLLGGGGILIGMEVGNHSAACPQLSNPSHGTVSCISQTVTMNRKCSFSCKPGYSIEGETTVVCSGGKWSGKPPICVPDCQALHEIDNGKYSCSDGMALNSTCNFTCNEHYELKGNSTATCLKNGDWSAPEPKCECPPCYVGYRCQDSINWKDVLKVLQAMQPYGTITVNYGEESFTCYTHLHSLISTRWTGICDDKKTATEAKCAPYRSSTGAAEHAASELVRRLIAQGKYPSPCDPGDMATGC